MRRTFTSDKKEFLRREFGIYVNKGDGPNSNKLLDSMKIVWDKNGKKITGVEYRGVKVIVSDKDEKFRYSENKVYAYKTNEFKELVRNAQKEHKKTSAAIVEENLQDEIDDIPEQLTFSVLQNSLENLEEEMENIEMDVFNNPSAEENELRVIRGILKDTGNDKERIPYLEQDSRHWREKAKKEENTEKRKLYEAISDLDDLKADQLRLKLNQHPKSERTLSIISEEAERNDLTRFERFKKWAKENLGTLSIVAISIAGIITTIVIGARNAVKKGGQAVGKFSKALAKLAEKAIPVIGGLLNLTAKLLEFGAKGISWLAKNLWVLAIAITYILYKEFQKRKNRK